MSTKPLPVGVDIFEHLITRGYYYVDKTNLIRDLLEQKCAVTLFTRPRRFGKTLNMSMLQYFFEDMRGLHGEPKDNRSLFEGLNIMSAGEKYLAHMGKYQVINLTLKGAKQPNFEMAFAMLKRQIALEFKRHSYILEDDSMCGEREKFQRIMQEKASRDDYNDAVQYLSQCLELYSGKKVIILIDEYDVPLENAFVRGFYTEMVDFIRSFFESALKTNASLEFAVITGCLRISKESIFTGMNNLATISILDSAYDEYFGFTEEDVRRMCEDYHMPEKYETIRNWYDGYVFGNRNVYNPWSVIQYMWDLRNDADSNPKPYWANTSSNSIVRGLIDMADESTKAEIEQLIEGNAIEKPVHEDITYGEVYESRENLWSFLFFTGYFRKVSERFDEQLDQQFLSIRIPNAEVRYIFRNQIQAWFQAKIKERDLTRLHNAFIEKDTAAVERELTEIMLETISSMDEHENYYHGLVAGLLTGIKGYITKSNRESGNGRCDLFVKPISRRKEAFVVEFKVTKKLPDLEMKTQEALKQIADKNYDRELLDDNYSVISHYGIAFCGKECAVALEDGSGKGK